MAALKIIFEIAEVVYKTFFFTNYYLYLSLV